MSCPKARLAFNLDTTNRLFALFATTLVGAAGLIACSSSTPDGRPVSTADVEVQTVSLIPVDVGATLARTLTASPGGGFVVLNFGKSRHWNLYQVDQRGRLASQRTFETSPSEAFYYLSATPSGLLMGGSSAMPDDIGPPTPLTAQFDSLRTLDANGVESTALRVSDVGDSHLTSCGAETADGFLLLGAKETGPEYWRTFAPWIGMASKDGKRLWEQIFPTLDGELITWNHGRWANECTGLEIDKHGTVTWAIRVESIPIPHSQDDLMKSANFAFVRRPGTLVVQLDAQGNLLRKVLHPYTEAAVLLMRSDGLTLVESLTRPWARPPLTLRDRFEAGAWSVKRTPPYDPRIRISTFDFELNEIRTAVTLSSDKLERVVAAHLTAAGGVLLVGCGANGGRHLLAYVTAKGSVSPVREAGTTEDCSEARFGEPSAPDAALLLALADEGLRVTTVGFSE